MSTAQELLNEQFLEMRARALSLAADIDRLQRGDGSGRILADPRLAQLHESMRIIMSPQAGRAERVQLLFSDHTPAPAPLR